MIPTLIDFVCLSVQVLKHSHQPLHLRKGDFYSYLSLSSHDSDCGEVSQCSDDKSATPPFNLPSNATPTSDLHSPSPELFTIPRPPTTTFVSSKNNVPALDLKSPDSPADASCSEQPGGPSVPPSPEIRDEETLFAACTEEVYLGPPLCYSMVLTKRRRADSPYLSYLSPTNEPIADGNQDQLQFRASTAQSSSSPVLLSAHSSYPTSSPSNSSSLQGPGFRSSDSSSSPLSVSSGAEKEMRGEDLYLLCDVAGGEVVAAASVSAPQEERSGNEGPPYLNPWARVAPIDSSAAKCLVDTKMLESNMGAVMTKISVCSSATNPSKEPATTATHINPKINCPAMREADREEGERRGEVDTRQGKQEGKGTRGRRGSQQEARTATTKQVCVPGISLICYRGTLYRRYTMPHLSVPGISLARNYGRNEGCVVKPSSSLLPPFFMSHSFISVLCPPHTSLPPLLWPFLHSLFVILLLPHPLLPPPSGVNGRGDLQTCQFFS